MDASNVVEIPGFFQNKTVKKITFGVEGITVETPGPTTFIPAENISAFRYRITWTRGYKFVFGRQYVLKQRILRTKFLK